MKEDQYEFFDRDSCDLCGLCLNNCPVLELPIEEAKKEFKRLVEGGETEHVMQKCTSCMTCNIFCPNDCLPYELILSRWYEKYKKNGLAPEARFLLTPHQPSPNVWTILQERLPDDEKKTLQSWSKLHKTEEMVYPGCVMCFPPYLGHSKIFDEFSIMMTNELCCGEPFYRIGVLDAAEQIAKRLEKQFKITGVKKMIFPCLGCYNTIKKLYPSRFNIKFEFESIALLDWLWEKIQSGKIKIKTKIDKKVTVHDNCHAKPFGTHFFDLTRKILKTLGVEIVEMEHNRENALCCGIAAFAIDQDPMDIINYAITTLKEAEETGADALVVNCGGCLLILSVAKIASRSKMPIYHILEIVQKAIGEEPAHRNEERAEEVFKILMQEGPLYLAEFPERYWMKPIRSDIQTKIV